MRSIFILLFVLSPLLSHAQEKNSLLWEISGNGLQQTSYLYGTMHVSKRIAFHLDDVFYQALDRSEIIALESDPDTWLDSEESMGFMGYGQGAGFVTKGFYIHPFKLRNPKKEDLAAYIAFEDRRINNILYRTNEFSQNFEEETYLDMFIYQAGKKFGKKVVALEDLEESAALVGRASMNAVKPKPDEWLQKKMQEQDPMSLLQEAYRNRNINMLDSIDKAMYTKHYLKNMLFTRNRNMANKLDSVMRTAKVFSGIGAAHLPGDQGVIAMLREMGYTVKPLTSRITSKGRLMKEKIEQTLRENTYTTVAPDDGIFNIALPNKLYPITENLTTTYISPDLANGSYVMLNRIPTFSHLKQDDVYSLEDIDKLLFENIPGKILEKTEIKRNGFKGLDIKNVLKNGDHQRYHIYKTPLEILIFKMGGEGDYVTTHSDTIFNSIAFKKSKERFTTISSSFKDFKVRMPSQHSFPNRLRKGNRLVQGFDSISGSYYFLRKTTLNDLKFIEEDTFELKQIQKRFYQDLKLSPKYDFLDGNTLTSSAVIDSLSSKNLHLKTNFRGGEYYLLGIVTKNKEEAKTYFESFQLNESYYKENFEIVQDTALFFSTISPVKPSKFVENSNSYFSGQNKPKKYNAYNKKSIYQNKNNEAILVKLNKSHDFLMFENIDSVWALRKKIYAGKSLVITNEKQSSLKDGGHQLELKLTDTASTRGILIKNVVHHGLLYELKAKVDTIAKPSRFVTEFFENFKPTDTIIGKSLLADKTTDFFSALRANDSIIRNGHKFIKFSERHIDSLKHYISSFDFPDDQKKIQSYLIQELTELDDPEIIDFFKRFYIKSYNNSSAQTLILSAIAKKADKESTELLLELMSKDFPVVSNSFEIRNIFKPYKDSLSLAKNLYPEILDYSSIEEYKAPIFSMLAKLKAKGLIKPKSYKKYRKQILNDAKLKLKRQLGKSRSKYGSSNRYNAPPNPFNTNIRVLEDYAILLYPFIKEKSVAEFFTRFQLIKDPDIRTTYAVLQCQNPDRIPRALLNELAKDINSRGLLFNKLKNAGKLHLFSQEFSNPKALAETLLFQGRNFDEERHSFVFLEQQCLKFRGKSFSGYYFKTKDKNDYDKNYKMHLVIFDDAEGLTTLPFYKNNGMRIEDTDTDKDVMGYVTEAFLLKDRKRAEVYRPGMYNGYGFHGY